MKEPELATDRSNTENGVLNCGLVGLKSPACTKRCETCRSSWKLSFTLIVTQLAHGTQNRHKRTRFWNTCLSKPHFARRACHHGLLSSFVHPMPRVYCRKPPAAGSSSWATWTLQYSTVLL